VNDRLEVIRRTPALVEQIVRAAARETLAVRVAHDRAPDVRDIANVALGMLDRALARETLSLDAVGRLELASATMRASTSFAQSQLARRLLRVPVGRFRPTPHAGDVALVDRYGAPHVVRIEAFAGDAQRVACARAIAVATATSSLRAPSIHFFSLRDGRLRTFAVPAQRTAHRAA